MQLITRNNLIDVCSLKIAPETDIKELLKPVSILRLRVDEFQQAGIERLGVAMTEPALKMTNTDRNWTIYQNDKYVIAETTGDQLYVTPWVLDSDGSFEYLKTELTNGKVLAAVQQNGYRIVARAADLDHLVVAKDYELLWGEACAAFLDEYLLSMVNWEYTARRRSRLLPLLKDEMLETSATDLEGKPEVIHTEEYFNNAMRELLAQVIDEVTDFVRQDVWAYYSVQHDRLGINITRHRDARALAWNKALMDQAEQEELDC